MADPYLQQASQQYNVPLAVLEGVAASEGSTWDTIAPGEGSVGRFQIHPVHAPEIMQKYGLTMQQLAQRPDIQIAYWAPRIAAVWNNNIAQGAAAAAWAVVNQVQAPAEEYRQREVNNIMAALGQPATQGGGNMVNQNIPAFETGLAGPSPTGTAPTEPGASTGGWTAFLAQRGLAIPQTDETGTWYDTSGYDSLPSEAKMGLWNQFSGGSAAAAPSAYEQAQTQATLAGIDSQWYNDKLAQYDRIVDAGLMSQKEAADDFQRLLQLKQEETARYGYATQRGADVLATLEKRAARTVSTPVLPGSEKGGFMSQVAAKYGLPAPGPLEFAPVSSFPNPWEVYGQAMTSAGLPQNLGAAGQGMPTVPSYTPPQVPEMGGGAAAGGGTFTVENGQRLLAQARGRQGNVLDVLGGKMNVLDVLRMGR